MTITSSADVTPIAGCSPFNGNLIISSDASGSIDLGGLTRIRGDLRCSNASQLTSISAGYLTTIGGVFDLEEIQILSSLSFGALTGARSIKWIALPGLQSLNFGQGVQTADDVYISNTGLTSLAGIELQAVGTMDVNNNNYLKTINVNGLKNITNRLSFSANGMNLAIDFPNLLSAGNLTFRNISSISVPSLSMVPGSIGFYSNLFESFSAPNLTRIGNTVAFVDSPELTNISMPSLKTINGGLFIANNTQLKAIGGFSSLTGIGGDINFYGTFDSVGLGPLTDVKGASNVFTSSSNTTICDLFSAAKKNQIIKGKSTCQTNSNNVAGNGTSSSSGSSSSKGAAVRNSNYDPTAPLTGFAAVIAAMLFI